MTVTILYTNGAPEGRDIDYFVRRLNEVRIETTLVDADSREGSSLTEIYDAMQRPTVLVTSSDGHLVQKWEGQLPGVSEVSVLANS